MVDGDPEYEIEFRWKEEVFYWEGHRGLMLDGGWGVTPPVTYVPSEAVWESVAPEWARGRREMIVARLVARTTHRVVETARYPHPIGVTR